jgi:DNA-binding MarR family transcriptional regulator
MLGSCSSRIVIRCVRLSTVYDVAVSTKRSGRDGAPPRPRNAFLLAQIGAHAAARFAELIKPLDLTPAQAGLLRLIAREPGQSQQALAGKLGTPASRLVLLVDGLEERGLIERRRDPADRRHHALYLTDAGGRFMTQQIAPVGAAHEEEICAGLTADERAELNALLERIAARQGLIPGVHPGYREPPRPATDPGESEP